MRLWLTTTLRAVGFGAVLYGGALALLHLRHNPHVGVLEALGLVVVFAALYGGWAAVATLVAAPVGLWWTRRRPGTRLDHSPQRQQRAGLGFGLFAFQAPFWLGFLLYGLTYDQGPTGPLESRAAMLTWVATLVVAALLLAAALSWLGARVVLALPRPRRVVLVAAVALAVLAPLLVATAAAQRTEAPTIESALPRRAPTGLKVMLVGFDGASWSTIDSLLASGELPRFRALQQRGVRADLATYPDSNSAVIWASAYSASLPAEHGVADFYTVRFLGFPAPGIFPVHRTYFKELVSPLERMGLARRITVSRYTMERPPFWEVLDHLQVSTGVADGYYYSLPVQAPATPESWRLGYTLDEWMTRAREDREVAEQAPLWLAPPELHAELDPLLVGAGGDFFWQARATLHMLETRPRPEVVSFYCHQPDAVSHLAWKWWQPELFLGVEPDELARRSGEIPQMFRHFDDFLASLEARLDPETVLFVVSDHGQSPTLLHASFFTQHRHGPPGIFLAAGGPIVAGAQLDQPHIDDLIPTIYWLLGFPVPADAPGRVLTEAFDPQFVASNPVRQHPTYRSFGAALAPRAEGDVGFNEEEIEKLRALGYL